MQFAKADLDVAKYNFEQAEHGHGDLASTKKEYEKLSQLTSSSELEAEIVNSKLETANNELKFIAAGPVNTNSKTTLIIPSNLMTGEHQVFLNGEKIPSSNENNQVTFEHIHIGNNQVVIKSN